MFDLDQLIELIDDLRRAGYNIGTQQYISAQDLLLALASRGQLPSDPRELRTWLAPVVCSTPKEQDLFYQYYEEWLLRHPSLLKDAPTTRKQAAKIGPTTGKPQKTDRSFVSRWRLPLAIAALLLIGGVGLGFYTREVTRTLTGQLIDGGDNKPLPKASVRFANQTVQSDDEGNFTVNYQRKHATQTVDIQLANYEPQNVPFTGRRFTTHDDLGFIALAKHQPITAVVVPDVTPLPVPAPTVPLPTFFERNFQIIRASAVLLPFVFLAAWWLWRKHRRRSLLQKLLAAGNPLLKRFVVKGAAAKLYRSQTFRRIAQELRRHRRRASREVDAQATVEATVLKGGMFVPHYASRKTLPEYLALVDRASLRDQQARLEDELINRLVEESVFVDRYYYNNDPRNCRTDTKPPSFTTLSDLASRHPDHRLMILGDGSRFFDAQTGQPEPWLDMFAPWSKRALLTPESPSQWGYREWALSELEFAVLPAGADGLAALVEVINNNTLVDAGEGAVKPFPELLQQNANRWLERHAAQGELTDQLCGQLRSYLGEDFDWLCACAVYPTLSWDLTLYFGYNLLGEREDFERRLVALLRLPWFRHGEMPDWLRMEFLAEMSPATESAVRSLLKHLLVSLLENPSEGIQLEIAPRTDEATRGWKRRLRQWAKKLRLNRYLSALPEESPLRDYVFLSFMSGNKPRPLDVSVPSILRRILYPKGQPTLGLRSVTAVVFAMVVSLLALGILNARQPKTQSEVGPQPQVSPTPYPTPTPDASPIAGFGTILTVPNGATLKVNLQYTNREFTVLLFQLANANGPLSKPFPNRGFHIASYVPAVTFDGLPDGNYRVAVIDRNNRISWQSDNFDLQAGFHEMTISSDVLATDSPTPTPTPTPDSDDGLVRIEAPDNSYIEIDQQGQSEIDTRFFRNANCQIQELEISPVNSVSIRWRDNAPPVFVQSVSDNLRSSLQQQTCAQIVAKYRTTAPPITTTPEPPMTLIDTWNVGAVTDSSSQPVFFTTSQAFLITKIQNYHWNFGKGEPAGTIQLRREDDGQIFGPWKVTAFPGSFNVPNVDWECAPNVVIPPGKYRVIDSSPQTWAANAETKGQGMTRVIGVRQTTMAPP